MLGLGAVLGHVYGLAVLDLAQAQRALQGSRIALGGQDLCQYQDAYGRSRSAQVKELSETVTEFLRYGAKAPEAAALVSALDVLVDN